MIGALIAARRAPRLHRRGVAADRLLPAGRDAGPVRHRPRCAAARRGSAPGTLWIAALTAALLPIERLVEPDRADGVLDQLALHGMAEESIAAAKIAAHWLTFAPLLLIAAVPASALLGMDGASLAATEFALWIGTPGLAALAVAVAAVTAGLPRAGSLAGLLLLPLAVPLLIFGAGDDALRCSKAAVSLR